MRKKGIEGIISREHMHKPFKKITLEIKKEIVNMATKNPRDHYDGLSFLTWSLRVLAEYISNKELNLEHHKSYSDKKYSSKTWD
jgi:predicted sulfurtransferase